MKLGLGTVQFGVDYGISNKSGKTSLTEVLQILNLAAENRIEYLDTAAMYGDSEEVIGKSLSNVDGHFNIVTKSPLFQGSAVGNIEAVELEHSFRESLQKTGVGRLHGLLIHQADDLIKPGGEHLVEKMRELQLENRVELIGVSVYSAEQLDQILEIFTPEIVQLPVNVFDQRLIQSGHLKRLKELGVEIHARSIFLQGLLLMDIEDVPKYFSGILDEIRQYHGFLNRNGLSLLQGAMQFINQLEEVDVAIVGVNSMQHLMQIIQAYKTLPDKVESMSRFSLSDPMMLNPACWKADR